MRHFGNPSSGLPAGDATRSCQLGRSNDRSSYSRELKEAISAGFLITFAISVASIFGVIVFFASLILEPSFDLQAIQYQRYVKADR